VLESAEIGGTIWFRVNVFAGSPCSGSDEKVTLSGWLPAYGADGQPNAWFWSRGC
jgi:hypothetical protein